MPGRASRFLLESSSSQRPGRSRSRPSPKESEEARRLKEEEELSASRLGYKSFEVESHEPESAFAALTLIGPGWVSIPAEGELLVLAPQRTILELKVDVESDERVLLLVPEGASPHVWLIGANYFATQAKDLLHGVDLHAAKHFSSLVFYRSQSGEVYTRPLKLAPVEEFRQYLHQDAHKRKVAVLKQKSNAVENQIRKIVDEEVRRSKELAKRIKDIDQALRDMAAHTDQIASRDYHIIQGDMAILHQQLDHDVSPVINPPTSGTLYDADALNGAPEGDAADGDAAAASAGDETPSSLASETAAPQPQAKSFAQLLAAQEKTLQRQRSLLQKMLDNTAARPPTSKTPTPKAQRAATPRAPTPMQADAVSVASAKAASAKAASAKAASAASVPRLRLPGLADGSVSTPEPHYKRGRALPRAGFVMTASKNSSRLTSSNSPPKAASPAAKSGASP